VNFLSFAKSSHAPYFDIDDSACASFDCLGCIALMVNGFIETDCGAHLFLQASMVVDVIVPQRLLNHEKVELIEFAKVLHLVQRIGRVGIATQHDAGPSQTNTL